MTPPESSPPASPSAEQPAPVIETAATPEANPYVGPRAFNTGEKLYGRDRESAELVDLLIAERIVLLYSPSGAGKSSLVNAAVIPQMQKQGFLVLPPTRVNLEPSEEAKAHPSFNRFVCSLMQSLNTELLEADRFTTEELLSFHLNTFMQAYRARLSSQGQPDAQEISPLLIIDQLEEIIRVDPANREAKAEFFQQLGELLRDRSLWVLLIIREDFLAALDPYLRYVPTRLATRYRLDFLEAPAAVEAIKQPAREYNVTFSDEAAQKLVDDLRRIRVQQADGTAIDQPGPYVEPVQLQVVCRRLWPMIQHKELVTVEDVTGLGSIDDALADYYASQVKHAAEASGVSERQIREWFDRKLITLQGMRGQVLMSPEVSDGLPNTVIKILQGSYLVRSDKRGNAVWFELAHDRLVRPIRRNNAEWFSAHLSVFQRQADLWNSQGRTEGLLLTGEDYLQARAWAESHADELLPFEKEFLQACTHAYQAMQRERRMNLLVRGAAVLMTILAIVALFFFLQAQDRERQARLAEEEARRQEAIAEQQKTLADQQAELARQQTRIANLNSQIAEARQLAASSVSYLSIDPELSVTLALRAVQTLDLSQPETRDAFFQAQDALRRAMPAMRIERVLKDPNLDAAHAGTAWSAAFTPSGQRVASAGNDGTVKIWEVLSGRLIQTIQVFTPASDEYGVTAIAFSPNGKTLAAATGDGRIFLYSTTDWEELDELNAHKGVIWGLTFSPDGNFLASGGADTVVRLWDLTNNRLALELKGHTGTVEALTFNNDGSRLASAGADKVALVWDTGSARIVYSLVGHTGIVNGVAFSPDGKRLATAGGEDRTIRIWDMTNGKLIMPITGHRDWVYSIAFSHDGRMLISTSADRTIRFWETTYGRPLMTLFGHTNQIFGLALSPDGKRIVTASEDRSVRIWNIAPEGSREYFTIDNHSAGYDLALSPDGNLLLTAGRDGQARLWEVSTHRLVTTLSGHKAIIEGVAFSADGKRMATAGRDGLAIVWDATTFQQLLTFTQHTAEIWDIAFSPDGAHLATASNDGTVKIWDATSGQVLFNLTPVPGWGGAFSLAFSPDGTLLASGYAGSQVVLWNTTDGSRKAILHGHTDTVQALAFSPDGQLLASAGDDGNIILWNLSSTKFGEGQAPLRSRGETIFGLAFSPNGKYLLAGGAEGIATVWNLEERQPAFNLYGHTDRIYAVLFSRDGQRMYTTGADATLRAYLFDFKELMDLASRRTSRQFTEEECRQLLNVACPADVGATTEGPATASLKRPGDMPAIIENEINDTDSSTTASEHRAPGGEDYTYNLFERPFNADDMSIYYPDLDIQRAWLSHDEEWIYVTITLAGGRGESGLLGNYAVELDLDVDGRGDFLITSLAPGVDWSTNGVRIWQDTNRDVGNGIPYQSDPPQDGNGYDTLLFDQGNGDSPDLAWARLSPTVPNSVQIAFQRKVINNDPVFGWLVWASRDLFKTAWFDYNDHFTSQQAGSALIDQANYPIKALAGLDNTCRGANGFDATGLRSYCQPEPSTP